MNNIKRFLHVIFAAAVGGVLLSAGGDHFLNAAEPETTASASNGLTPVKMAAIEGLAPLVIAEGDVARTPIVPAPDMPYYREVAEFLADHLRQATGVKFTVTASPTEKGEAIYVGPVKVAGAEKILEKAAALTPEHFIVERFSGGVILVGNDRSRSLDMGKPLTIKDVPFAFGMTFCSKGSYLAAVDFLERFVGVRWYFWGPLGVCIPDLRGKTLSVPPVSYEDGPVFPLREAWGVALDPKAAAECGIKMKDYSEYYALNDFQKWGNRNCKMYPVGVNHTDCDWNKLYAKDHPEYFALRADGTRMVGEEGKEFFSAQRCYSNEAGFQQHLKNIEQYLSTGRGAEAFTDRPGECLPNKDFIYWAPNDGFTGCVCPDCQAHTDKNASPSERSARLIWEYVVKLAKAIKEKWPEKKLCVFGAYFGNLPSDIKLPDNVLVDLTLNQVPDCYMKEPKYRQANQELVDFYFSKTGKKVSLWMYADLPYAATKTPYPYGSPHVLADFIRANRNKICGARVLITSPMNVPDLCSKLLWNPDIDVDAFLADYAEKMFGPAAPRMKEFLDLCASRWEDTRWSYLPPPNNLSTAIPEQMIWKETYPREVRDRMQRLLDDALAAAPVGTIQHQRLEYMTRVYAPFFEEGRIADSTVKPLIDCLALKTPVVVDGDLGEWEGVTPVALKDWKGGKAREKTEFMVARDQNAIYIAGRVFESDRAAPPPRKGMNNIYGYDSVEIYLCPEQVGLEEAGMAKSEQFFQIALNALGETAVNHKTLQQTNWGPPRQFDFASAVKPMGNGFQFEIKIPYASLGAPPPREGRSEWLVNFYRNRPRGEDKGYQAWSPTMGKAFFNTSCFGLLRFSRAASFSINFEDLKEKKDKNILNQRTEGVEMSSEVQEGKLVVNIKAKPDLHDNASPYIDLAVPVMDLDKPVMIEMMFRCRGKGVAGVGFCVKDSYDENKHRNSASYQWTPLHAPDEMVENDWITGCLKVPQDRFPLRNLEYWDVELSVAPRADFVLEVASIRVLPCSEN